MEGSPPAPSKFLGGAAIPISNSEDDTDASQSETYLRSPESLSNFDNGVDISQKFDGDALSNINDTEIIQLEMRAAAFARHVIQQQQISVRSDSIQSQSPSPLVRKSSVDKPCSSKRTLKCIYCDKAFVTSKALQSHTITVHNPNNIPLHFCEICQKAYETLDKLRIHRQKHTDMNTHACLFCSKRFKSKLKLKDHENIHRNAEQRFICAYENCEKSFTSRKLFENHTQKHTNDLQTFACPICEKSFKRRSHRNSHVRETHSGEKAFSCSRCTKKFTTENARDNHFSKAHLEVFQQCLFCTFQCSDVLDMKEHIRKLHENDKVVTNNATHVSSLSPVENSGSLNEFNNSCELEENAARMQMRQTVNGILEKIDKDLGIKSDVTEDCLCSKLDYEISEIVECLIEKPSIIGGYEPDISYFSSEQLLLLQKFDISLDDVDSYNIQHTVSPTIHTQKKRGRPKKNLSTGTSNVKTGLMYQQHLSTYRNAALEKEQSIFAKDLVPEGACGQNDDVYFVDSSTCVGDDHELKCGSEFIQKEGSEIQSVQNSRCFDVPLSSTEKSGSVCSVLSQCPQKSENCRFQNSSPIPRTAQTTANRNKTVGLPLNHDASGTERTDVLEGGMYLADISLPSQRSSLTSGSSNTINNLSTLASSSFLSSPSYSQDQQPQISHNSLVSVPVSKLDNTFSSIASASTAMGPPLVGHTAANLSHQPNLSSADATSAVSPVSVSHYLHGINSSAAAVTNTVLPPNYLSANMSPTETNRCGIYHQNFVDYNYDGDGNDPNSELYHRMSTAYDKYSSGVTTVGNSHPSTNSIYNVSLSSTCPFRQGYLGNPFYTTSSTVCTPPSRLGAYYPNCIGLRNMSTMAAMHSYNPEMTMEYLNFVERGQLSNNCMYSNYPPPV